MTAPVADVATPARRAGFVSRLAAFVVDAVLLAAAMRGAGWIFLAAQHALGGLARHVNVQAIMFAAVPIVSAAVDVVLWRLYGQTPGKWLMGLKVVPVRGGGMSIARALARFGGYFVSALPLYAGFLWMLGPSRRGWHDLLAGTEVIYVARRPRIAPGDGGLPEQLPAPA
jgi:uncharacterized RDD family membrane protein YckC